MGKKLVTMSISVEPERHRLLKRHAERAGHDNVSLFVRQWLDQYPFNKHDVLPVVIDVPKVLLEDRPALEKYLDEAAKRLLEML